MNIRRIELSNYGSWESLDLPIEPGVTLISGSNGAGKSTILSAAEFCLFGATSDAGRLIRRGTDEAVVRVYLEDGLVIKRAVRRSGTTAKVALSVRRFLDEEDYDDLTAATVTETQAVIDGILGVTRETLRASALSMQGDGAAFCEAKPADRKRVLTAALPSMEIWPLLHEQAKAEKRTADDAANVARAEQERLDGAGNRMWRARATWLDATKAVEAAAEHERKSEDSAETLALEAEAAREARRQHAAAVEAEARARADHERAGVERTAADEALARAKAAAANAPSVEAARSDALDAEVQLGNIEAEQTALREASTKWREQFAEAEREFAKATGERDRNTIEIGQVQERITQASSGTCPECLQVLHDDSLLTRLKDRRHTLVAAQVEVVAAYADWKARVDYLKAHSGVAPDDAKLRLFQRRAQEAQTALARAESIRSLAGSIDAAQQRSRDAFDRQNETAEQLRAAKTAQLATACAMPPIHTETSYQDALTALTEARAAHSAAAAELARAEEAAKLAERQAAEETAARERLEVATREAAVAGVLCEGFGPNGVSAMILDSVLGGLSDEWNRVLAELGLSQRIDLRSQKVLKTSERLADTLDIIVMDGVHEAPFETLSGGEKTCVSAAGRRALTTLLASKTGARVGIMVLDEPQGLDRNRAEALMGVLNAFVATGLVQTILMISHDDALADLAGRCIRVEKGSDGVSRLVGSGVEVAA